MATVDYDTYDERRYLFTNDTDRRANLFTKALEECTAKDLSKDNCSLLRDIALSKNYLDAYKAPGMRDQDIHYEFTDFIVKSALFHRKIDRELSGGARARNISLRDSSEAKAVYDNVYANWNRLSQETQQFYNNYVQLLRRRGGDWEPVMTSELPVNIPNDQLDDYRINLKKAEPKDIPVFGSQLPVLGDDVKNIYYTKEEGKRDSIKAKRDSLRDIYQNAYKRGGDFKALPKAPNSWQSDSLKTANGIFHVNVDKLVRKRLFRIKKARVGTTVEAECNGKPPVEEEERDSCYGDLFEKNVWYRDCDGFYRVENGRNIRWGVDTENTKKSLSYENSCYSTLVDQDHCEDHVFSCLLENDSKSLDKCLQVAKKVNFNDVSRDQISKMHPIVAVRTLQSFGFGQEEKFDSVANMKIKKVQTLDSWLAKNKEKVDRIVPNNTDLLNYLRYLVEFVNSNPGILNKNYGASTEEKIGQVPRNKYLSEIGVDRVRDPAGAAARDLELKLFRRNLSSGLYGSAVASGRSSPFQLSIGGTAYTPFGKSVTPYVSPIAYRPQAGGMGGANWLLKKHYDDRSGKFVGAAYISQIFDIALSDLAARNKSLERDDVKKLRNRIDSLHNEEKSIIKSIHYIEEYVKLMDAFRDNKSDTLDLEKLKDFVNRYNKQQMRYHSNEEYLLSILQTIEELSQKEGKSKDYEPIHLDFSSKKN